MAIEPREYRQQLADGPRKERFAGPPEPYLSTHKQRANWFRSREAWPYREASGSALVSERERVARECVQAAGATQWEFVGPSNIGGRMTSLVCHPTDADRIIAGAAGGGIWRSTDGGRTWEGLWHKEPTLNIGSLALDTGNPDVIYCGTGEANLSADSHAGVGLFRSMDGGDTWELLAASSDTGLPTRIGTIAVDPNDPGHIRLGGVSHGTGTDGMWTSRDGGTTWIRETFATTGSYRCHDIQFDPVRRNVLYTAITARGVLSGIWRSEDGGQTWTHLLSGLPDPTISGRGALAIAPSDTSVLYAQFADRQSGVLGVYRSGNGGDSWTNIAGAHFADERQMFYNNTIAVHPANPDHVVCGGVDIHRTNNGGQSWQRVTDWWRDRGDPQYAHADQHRHVMPTARPGIIYAANDGGIDRSDDGGETWENRSNGLAATMYYDLEMAQSDGRIYGGGCQDNGTNITQTGHIDDHFMISGGDGGWITIDPTNPLHLYASSQQMRIVRFRQPEGWVDVSPLPQGNSERSSMWMVFIAMDQNDPRTVFTGTQRVWRTRNDGDTWLAVSSPLDGSDITAIEVAAANSQLVYVGTNNGGIFRSTDGGDSWSGDLSGPLMPGRQITRLKASPADADLVYATVANFDNNSVFRSRDGGVTWEDIDQGRLPRVPHNGIAISSKAPNRVFVCSDVGVHVSEDGGDSWSDITRNLPNVMVIDMVYHIQDNTLTVATYGRSLWRLGLD